MSRKEFWVHAVLLFAYLEFQAPRTVLERHREAWHRRCDAYVGTSIETPGARDCARELHELKVYAKMKGLVGEVEDLTAYAKVVGWALVEPEVRLIQSVRPALELSGELLDRVKIPRDRRGGEVTALEFLQHQLATWVTRHLL